MRVAIMAAKSIFKFVLKKIKETINAAIPKATLSP